MKKFIKETAFFANKEATVIIVNVEEEDGSIFNIAIDVSPNPLYTEFNEQISLDEVYKNTNERIKLLEKDDNEYRQFHLEELKKFVVNEFAEELKDEIKEKISKEFNVFKQKNNQSLTDIKFELFAIDTIKNSKNSSLKTSLRKSITPVEALAYASAILIEESKK